jgi:hypothetical protein
MAQQNIMLIRREKMEMVRMSQQFKLMREKRFLPFFCTQFLGALNDNVFKTTLITMAVFHTDDLTTLNGAALATSFCFLPRLGKSQISLKSPGSFVLSKSSKCC